MGQETSACCHARDKPEGLAEADASWLARVREWALEDEEDEEWGWPVYSAQQATTTATATKTAALPLERAEADSADGRISEPGHVQVQGQTKLEPPSAAPLPSVDDAEEEEETPGLLLITEFVGEPPQVYDASQETMRDGRPVGISLRRDGDGGGCGDGLKEQSSHIFDIVSPAHLEAPSPLVTVPPRFKDEPAPMQDEASAILFSAETSGQAHATDAAPNSVENRGLVGQDGAESGSETGPNMEPEAAVGTDESADLDVKATVDVRADQEVGKVEGGADVNLDMSFDADVDEKAAPALPLPSSAYAEPKEEAPVEELYPELEQTACESGLEELLVGASEAEEEPQEAKGDSAAHVEADLDMSVLEEKASDVLGQLTLKRNEWVSLDACDTSPVSEDVAQAPARGEPKYKGGSARTKKGSRRFELGARVGSLRRLVSKRKKHVT